jgi:hypothetical protein
MRASGLADASASFSLVVTSATDVEAFAASFPFAGFVAPPAKSSQRGQTNYAFHWLSSL